MFGNDTWVKLDPFHAVQKFTSKIPSKGVRGVHYENFALVILPTKDEKTKKRNEKKTTPCEDTIEKNIKTFLEQWKDVDYEGMQLVPQVLLMR